MRKRTSPREGVQSKYLFGFTAEYVVNPKLALGFAGTGTSSSSVGFGRLYPSTAVKAVYNVTRATQASVDLGTRVVSKRMVSQSFGDIAVNQTLRRNLALNVGLGTTFNAVPNVKAHYLASGFTYQR
jgi:hypothetical protein